MRLISGSQGRALSTLTGASLGRTLLQSVRLVPTEALPQDPAPPQPQLPEYVPLEPGGAGAGSDSDAPPDSLHPGHSPSQGRKRRRDSGRPEGLKRRRSIVYGDQPDSAAAGTPPKRRSLPRSPRTPAAQTMAQAALAAADRSGPDLEAEGGGRRGSVGNGSAPGPGGGPGHRPSETGSRRGPAGGAPRSSSARATAKRAQGADAGRRGSHAACATAPALRPSDRPGAPPQEPDPPPPEGGSDRGVKRAERHSPPCHRQHRVANAATAAAQPDARAQLLQDEGAAAGPDDAEAPWGLASQPTASGRTDRGCDAHAAHAADVSCDGTFDPVAAVQWAGVPVAGGVGPGAVEPPPVRSSRIRIRRELFLLGGPARGPAAAPVPLPRPAAAYSLAPDPALGHAPAADVDPSPDPDPVPSPNLRPPRPPCQGFWGPRTGAPRSTWVRIPERVIRRALGTHGAGAVVQECEGRPTV